MSLTMPTIQVEVAFANNPYDSSLTWTDITRYVEGFSTTMGRQHELQQVQPSTAAITLSNEPEGHGDTTGGRFSPWNTGSPYYHSGAGLVPTKPVKITATWASTTYPIFYGYAKAWVPQYGQSRSTVQLQCYDILALLNLNTLDTSQYVATVEASAFAYYQLGDPPGATTAADSMGGTAGIVHGGMTFGNQGPILSGTTNAVLAAYGWNITIPSGISGSTVSATGWVLSNENQNSNIIVSTGAASHLVTLGTASSTGFASATVGTTTLSGSVNVCDGNWHFLAVTAGGGYVQLYVDGRMVAISHSSPTVTAAAGAICQGSYPGGSTYFSQVAVYNVALTPTQVQTQYQIAQAGYVQQDSGSRCSAVVALAGVPNALNNIGAGSITVQAVSSPLRTTTAMSYLNTIVNTERGFLWQDTSGVIQYANRQYVYQTSTSTTSQYTFGYASGQLHYFDSGIVPTLDDLDLWNNIPVARQGGVPQTASDSTSITAYGRRTLASFSSLLFVYDTDAMGLAGGLLYQYKQPKSRVRSISMNSTIEAGANLPAMLGLSLLNRVTINWRPLDGSSVDFSQQSLIEAINHTVTPDTWATTFAVTPIGTESFFIVGTSTLGTGVLGI